jgi:multiple sugar transport system ATP-binding protein
VAEIVLDHITKRFPDGSLAVNDFNLDIADGEFVILVGPSGCGKSTTLNMIAGLEDITSGELRIGGQVVNNKTPKDRDIAMVFQSYALYPHMTVRQNMGFALKLAKTPQNVINEKVEEAARILDLTQYLDRKPANLSGGQRQRVAMGRAIVRNPAVFLMDEPLSNLDAKLRVQMRTEVSRIQRRLGTTTVYVTHDQVEALTLGDRVAVMRTGVLQQAGTPKELYERPVNLFVAGFIGSPAMNFLAGTLEDGMLRTNLGDFRLSDRLRHEVERSGTGRDVIVGLRPENFEDAALVAPDNRPNGITFAATIDVLESLGSDVFVYFTQGREQGVSARELEELAHDSGRDDTGASGDTIVARLDASTQAREGHPAELWVDARAMHIFDPATGRNLSLAADDGGGAVQAGTGAPTAAQPASSDSEAGGMGDAAAAAGQAVAGDASAGEEVEEVTELPELSDCSPEPLDDLVVPFVGPDQPVPLGGDPHVGLGVGAGADHVGGLEHPHHGPVFVGVPPAGDLGTVHEPVVVLHAPAPPRLDGLAELGVRPRIGEGDLGVSLLGQRDPGPEQPLVVLDHQVSATADARRGHRGEDLRNVGLDRGGAGGHRDRDAVMAVLHEVQDADAVHVDRRDRLAAPLSQG